MMKLEAISRSGPASSVDAETVPVRVRDLTVRFGDGPKAVHAVNGVSFALQQGEVLGILGESGSGKSVMLRSLIGLLPEHARTGGSVEVAGRSIFDMPRSDLRKLRGSRIAMIFQEPMTAFDPVFTIGRQITETVMRHDGLDAAAASARALELLELVAIPSAKNRLRNYPYEMSGGMRQRAMIALALACRPSVLLADEPTTALDVTVQIQILLLLRRLQAELGMAVVFVTHDIGVAVEISDRIGVMYAGRFVEEAPVETLIDANAHPYTRGLLASTVHGQRRGELLKTIPGAPPNLADLPRGCPFSPRCDVAEERCRTEPPAHVSVAPDHHVRCIHAVPNA